MSSPELRGYFEAKAGEIPKEAQFIGRWGQHGLLGVVAVWNYSGWDCEVGWAGEPGWLSRRFLITIFAYLFRQLNCQRVTGRIHESNAAALKASQKLGFVHEGTMRKAAEDGGSVLVFGLLREQCRYGRFE